MWCYCFMSLWMCRMCQAPQCCRLPVALSTAATAINHQRFTWDAQSTRSGTASGMTPRHARLLLLLLLELCASRTRAGGKPDEDRDKRGDAESPCEVKTVTVSTLPVLRENEFSFTGAGSGSLAGGESRLMLFVRTDLPGRISVLDDLDNTALPYFTLGEIWLSVTYSIVRWEMTALCVLPVLMHVEIGGNEQNDHCRAIKVFQCFCAAPESSCSVWDLRDISKTGLKCLLDFSYSCMEDDYIPLASLKKKKKKWHYLCLTSWGLCSRYNTVFWQKIWRSHQYCQYFSTVCFAGVRLYMWHFWKVHVTL